MDANAIFSFIGGLSLFIYGINIMGEGLKKSSGNKIRLILKNCTSNIILSVAVGAILTAIVQSSSAISVLAIGFVNAGLMTFNQSLGIIFGANIGTTVTAQLIAFKLTKYALLITAIGFLIYFIFNNDVWKNLGYSILGMGILFLGMSIMTGGIKPLASSIKIRNLFITYSNNLLISFLIGLIITAIFQSSSCTTGIVITLASSGLIAINGAISIIFGCNIGTCVTALLASIGTSRKAKQVAVSHIIFNTVGSLLFFPLIPYFQKIVVLSSSDIARQCANAHTLFNILGVLIFLPFTDYFVKLINKFFPLKEEEDDSYDTKYLDSKLVYNPSLAIYAATKETVDMLKLAKKMIFLSIKELIDNDHKKLSTIDEKENIVDYRRLAITDYIVEIIKRPINENESSKIAPLIHVVNDVERIADHANNIHNIAKHTKKLTSEMTEDLNLINNEIMEMVSMTIESLLKNNTQYSEDVLEKEKCINMIRDKLKKKYICKISKNSTEVITTISLLDVINNMEKIGDYLKNIAEKVIQFHS